MTAKAVAEPTPALPPASVPEREAFDAASRFITISGRGGKKPYLPVQARVDWFRHDVPDGLIDQQHVEINERWAMFKTTVTRIIDGEVKGRADGYGMEFAKDFEDFILKAATVSLGRALNALGYGGSDLDEGIDAGNVADAPIDAGGQPTPIDKGRRATTPPKDARERESRRFHAVGESHGWTDAALHLLALSEYPKRQNGRPTTSRAELDAGELGWLADLIEKTIGRIADADGTITPTPEVEYANAIAKADLATLDQIAKTLKEGGIAAKWLILMGQTRKHELMAAHGQVS